MSVLTNLPRRFLLLTAILMILLISGLGLAATRHTSVTTSPDCPEDCRAARDKHMEKCEEQPEERREKCREIINKKYDKCLEMCNK